MGNQDLAQCYVTVRKAAEAGGHLEGMVASVVGTALKAAHGDLLEGKVFRMIATAVFWAAGLAIGALYLPGVPTKFLVEVPSPVVAPGEHTEVYSWVQVGLEDILAVT